MKEYVFIKGKKSDETDKAYRLELSDKRKIWFPKKSIIYIKDSIWHIPVYLAAEKDLIHLSLDVEFDYPKLILGEAKEVEYEPRTPFYTYQSNAFQKMVHLVSGALFMDMGTGKTKVAIDLATYRFKQGLIDRLIYLCPINVLAQAKNEFEKHGMPDLWVYFFGIESFSSSKTIADKCASVISNKTMIVIDEIHLLKNIECIRTQAIQRIAQQCCYRLGLTGTPMTHSPRDLFGIFSVLDSTGRIIGYNKLSRFMREHIVIDSRKQLIGYANIDKLTERLVPFIFQVNKSECLDLPDKIYNTIHADSNLTDNASYKEYLKHYADTRDECLLMYEKSKNPNHIMRMIALLQIISGGGDYYEKTGYACPKLSQTVEFVKNNPARWIIWCRYTKEIEALQQLFQAEGIGTAKLNGEIRTKDRNAILKRWAKSENHVLISNAATGGVGIDLTASDKVIFYSNSFNYAHRLQAEDRCHRIGQKSNVVYYDIMSGFGIEERVLKNLRMKKNVKDDFIELIHNNQISEVAKSL